MEETIRTITETAPTTLLLSQTAWEVIEAETRAAGRKETGGLLVGKRLSYQGEPFLVAVAACGPGTKADRQLYTYAPEVEVLQNFLNQSCEKYAKQGIAVNYMGEWHKHPEKMHWLSTGDIKQGQAILEDPSYQLTHGELVLPIANLVGKGKKALKEVKLHPYYLSFNQPVPVELELIVWENELIMSLLQESTRTAREESKR